MPDLYEIQFHRHDGADESFEAETLEDALRVAREERSPATWLVQIIDPQGRIREVA